jgi:hypothetical protein
MGVRGEIFSNRIILPNRTYFFNVKENRMGDLYLNIVESKNRDSGGFERQSVVLFADDLQEFLKGFDESLKVMEKAMREKRQSGKVSKRTESDSRSDDDSRGKGERSTRSRSGERNSERSSERGNRSRSGSGYGSERSGKSRSSERNSERSSERGDRSRSGERGSGYGTKSRSSEYGAERGARSRSSERNSERSSERGSRSRSGEYGAERKQSKRVVVRKRD